MDLFVLFFCACSVYLHFFVYVCGLFCVSFCLFFGVLFCLRFIITPEGKPRTVDFVGAVCSGHGGCVINYHQTSMVKIVLHLHLSIFHN